MVVFPLLRRVASLSQGKTHPEARPPCTDRRGDADGRMWNLNAVTVGGGWRRQRQQQHGRGGIRIIIHGLCEWKNEDLFCALCFLIKVLN